MVFGVFRKIAMLTGVRDGLDDFKAFNGLAMLQFFFETLMPLGVIGTFSIALTAYSY